MLKKIYKILFTLMIAYNALIGSAIAAPVVPELEKMQKDLEGILNKYPFKYEIAQYNNTLKIKYNTNKFMVHTIHKTGYLSPKPHEEIGPNHDGFLIELSVHDGEYLRSAAIPQELKEPYWKTYINAYSISNGKQYIWISFSYGVRTNKDLIKGVINLFGKPFNSEILERNNIIEKE